MKKKEVSFKLNWQNHWKMFYWGYDEDLKTGIIKNKVFFAILFKGYWIGICK